MNPETGSGEEKLRSALNKAELEALEALKLQYFQNATQCLAKGDYDNALLEIKRVLLIDPEHRLAREYEIRVTELQAARALTQKAEPAPLAKEVPREKKAPRVAPVVFEAPKPAPAPSHGSRKTWLYSALIALLLLGTAGVLTLEKVNDEEEPPAATVAAVTPQVPAPVEQTAESTMVEPTPPIVAPAATVEPKHAPVVVEKRVPKPEPARREQPITAPARTSSAGTGLLAIATEKKVEPPPAPVTKEVPMIQPEMKPAVTPPPPPEPTTESVPFVATEKEPRLVRLEKVRLPDITLGTHISGEVRAKVLVDRDGKPKQVEIVSSSNSFFDQPVIDALQKSTFSPGMMGTEPVSAWLLIPFKFK